MRRTAPRRGRRDFLRGGLALAGLGLLAGCGVGPPHSRRAAHVPRIGYLVFGRAGPSTWDDAFRQGLAELGYVEGGNLAIEWRFTQRAELVPGLAAELVRLPVDLIVAAGGAVNVAKDATAMIPIVMPVSGDPVGQGLVASLARPGGNITGLTTLSSSELARKRLQLLKEVAPEASRVAVLWNPGNPGKAIEFQQAQAAAAALGLTLHSLEVRGPDDFDGAFGAAAAGHADALNALSEALINDHAARIAHFALAGRLPSVFELRELADAGGLMSYGPNVHDLFRRAAAYVDRILKGANPADLPVEQPTKFDFVLNLRTAQALGRIIPQSAPQQATELIQ
jgi:putative ABC transport system substrate-binding protein